MSQKLKVVCVDDDQDVLDFIVNTLTDDHEVLDFNHPSKALEYLEKSAVRTEISTIISDLKMPGMTGIEFLSSAAKILPDASRIMLTGHGRRETPVDAINIANVHGFLSKPFDVKDLVQLVSMSEQRFRLKVKNLELVSEITQMNTELEENVRQKTDEATALLRLVCHDVGNPLSVVAGNLQILQSQIKDRKFDRFLKPALDGCNYINDILDTVRELQGLISGKIPSKRRLVDLSSIVDHVHLVFDDKFKAKNITFTADGYLGVRAYCDETLVKNSVIGNLISNAIKFTEAGGSIKLTVSTEGNRTKIEVTDCGIGIPQDLIERLFDPSAETSREGTDGERGTGFGMPIMKKVVELCEGSVEVKSDVDPKSPTRGTTFTVRFLNSSVDQVA